MPDVTVNTEQTLGSGTTMVYKDIGGGVMAPQVYVVGAGGVAGAAAIADGADVTQGAIADAAVDTDVAGTVSGKLRGLVKLFVNFLSRLPAALGANGGLKVEGVAGGVAVPVSLATAPVLVAGEAHVGQVGGLAVPVSATPAIAAGLFHAGDNVGGKLTFTNAMRINGGSGTLQRLFIVDTANQKAPLELVIFSQNPAAATLTDNAAFVFSTDIQYAVARITIPTQDWVTINGIALLHLRNLGIPIVTTGAQRNLYGGLVTLVSPPTYTLNCLRVDLGIYND